MKIGFHGCTLPEGTHKYADACVSALAEKFSPKKVTPYYMTFLAGALTGVDAFVVTHATVLDVLLTDIELCEGRSERTADAQEKAVMEKCLAALEAETPLCDVLFTPEEETILRGLSLVSRMPVALVDDDAEVHSVMEAVLRAARTVFFYTAGPKEVRAWPVKEHTDIVTCAGVIHSDLARGFIRADVVSCADLLTCHNFAEAKSRGLVHAEGKAYTIQAQDVIEIHFSV